MEIWKTVFLVHPLSFHGISTLSPQSEGFRKQTSAISLKTPSEHAVRDSIAVCAFNDAALAQSDFCHSLLVKPPQALILNGGDSITL